jgi:hypothetical protein
VFSPLENLLARGVMMSWEPRMKIILPPAGVWEHMWLQLVKGKSWSEAESLCILVRDGLHLNDCSVSPLTRVCACCFNFAVEIRV